MLVDDETCIFTAIIFVEFVLVLVMLHSTVLDQITFAYVISSKVKYFNMSNIPKI